jgi:hypothetical protein
LWLKLTRLDFERKWVPFVNTTKSICFTAVPR